MPTSLESIVIDTDGLLFQREAKFFKLHERGDKVVWQRKATGDVTLSRDGSTGKMLLKIVRRSTAKLCASLMLSADMLFRSEHHDDPNCKRSWLWKGVDHDGAPSVCALRFTCGEDSDSFIRALKHDKIPRAAALHISISRLQEPDLNHASFGLTPISSEYRGPYRTGNISPRPADLSDENVVQAYNAVRDVANSTNWLLLNYTSEYSNKIVLSEMGSGGLDELLDRLESTQVSYAYLKLVYVRDTIKRTKFAFIKWIGSDCPFDQIIKASDAGEVREIFKSLSFEAQGRETHALRDRIEAMMKA